MSVLELRQGEGHKTRLIQNKRYWLNLNDEWWIVPQHMYA